MKIRLVLVAMLAIVLAACAPGASGTPERSGPRAIEVTMTDELRFEPAEFSIAAGETVRFEVRNAGEIVHEFYIGDQEAQAQHEDEMRELNGGMMHDEPGGVSVEPGQSETLEYTFDRAGDLLAGCHEPGHYDAGMVATITVD